MRLAHLLVQDGLAHGIVPLGGPAPIGQALPVHAVYNHTHTHAFPSARTCHITIRDKLLKLISIGLTDDGQVRNVSCHVTREGKMGTTGVTGASRDQKASREKKCLEACE